VTDSAPNAARLADAFAAADPAAYVPRLALEAALAELAEVIGKTPACAALAGEAGLGKTLLLKVLRERLLGAFECLYVPFPRLSAPELWRWAAVALGLGTGDDDRGAVLGRARRLRDEGSGLVLLVDDAGALPPSTRADLLAALETTGFTVVLAFSSEDQPQLGSLPAFVRRVEIGPPMTLSETRSYVHARLRRVDPDGAVAARLTAERLAELHDASGGVPARLHGLLAAWLPAAAADAPSAPAEPSAAFVPAPVVAATPAAVGMPELPEGLRTWVRRLERPAVRLSLIALVVVATLGAWLFAWQKGPGIASVGVPVDQVEAPRADPAPPRLLAPTPAEDAPDVASEPPPEAVVPEEPAPTAPEVAPPVDAPPPPESPPTSTGPSAPEAMAARGQARALAPLLPPAPPLPDPNRPELPVDVSTLRFPDEHVPPLLEPEPLAAPPAGPRLSVNARPWAAISLDGTPVGETPLGELRITPGAHVVSAKLPDGRVVERTVEARAGDVYLVFP
jgi:type II secretory pathway predicted ATPase ExeA